MNPSQIEEFGRILVQRVRDAAVNSCDQQLAEHARSPIAKRWREASDKAVTMIPDCVDETIFHLLQAIDQGAIQLSFRSENGEFIDLTQDGQSELAGWFMAHGGWRSTYATERFNDDFADL